MDLIYHRLAAKDAREIALKYGCISDTLCDRFWNEFDQAIEPVLCQPERHHFDPSGKRRKNLKRFPYHILFEIRLDCIRVLARKAPPEESQLWLAPKIATRSPDSLRSRPFGRC